MTHDTMTAIRKGPFGDAGDRQTHSLEQNNQNVQPVRSLVIDDDSTILRYVALILAMLKFQEVETAQKKPEVMEKLSTGPYDLLLTDLEMPDVNGYRLSRMIKKKRHGTKIIMMTGRDKNDCHGIVASKWVDGWLFKPFGLKELRPMLQCLGMVRD
ncbi:response regulator [Desulfosudis oleivorans]|uniref:Response regulator receiver protein n=1 Tax=Desulfosudis oleivorans (strain DSM 6200 / JCM 39069 / Hxd3) TaxID=96561 RepID=A8ZV28_DESOH|nr:response regulator [Desulfosudis oleivorans]ABW68118.1 response regulator receiver protein [Desulfosudis oleivorans Hxd3]